MNNSMMTPRARLLATALALASPAVQAQENAAPAADIPCDGRFRTQVVIDGFQRDWEAEATPAERFDHLIAGEAEFDWTGPADASFRMWCRYAEHGLYFAVVGRDNALSPPVGRADGDRLELLFDLAYGASPARVAMITVPLWPALEEGRVTPSRTLDGRTDEPTGAVAEIARRDTGFFAEIYLPFSALPGLGRPLGPMPFALVQRDIDHDGPREQEVGVASAAIDPRQPATWNRLIFTAAEDRIRRMRESTPGGLDRPVHGPAWGRIREASGPVFAAVIADLLLLSGEGLGDFSWVGLPLLVDPTHELLSLEMRDIDGDGVDEVVALVRRSRDLDGDEGRLEQDVLHVLRYHERALVRLFQQEVALRRPGAWSVEATLSWQDRRATRLRVDGARAEGVDRGSFIPFDDAARAGGSRADYEPMPLPWQSTSSVTWTRDGSGFRPQRTQ